MKRTLTVLASLTTLAQPVHAVDYGVFGALFPVEEPSVLDTIMNRLTEMEGNGELAQMQQDMQDKARARVNRPIPVPGMRPAEIYRSYNVDLSITLDRDLSDHRGVVFARAGTRVNPLDHSRFNQRLVFIDGDDPDQVAFAVDLANQEPVKLILVNGPPLELTETHQMLFYFDQGGVISERFGLTVVPSVVSRADPLMLVEEIPVSRGDSQ
ncbi:type-F conjugative transfer system protein TraW [Roseobacter sp. HKCCD9010]|uniref:type-F conjugative transfer system protein TraW n=1 Tax=unclassified Roseobacter TaxID=196798 RepID=UPI0014918DD8|nr:MULTISPECIES: type-F conjugative transfer system protein TraW [unclassified Roseobacter]MBF9052267.1 type-F conjugative transfer system protein TraW [Rhodobacterales bacterium HKCCD4356]NNV14213.1 type-F conjugative transfer system protein TraW [Roseobacter sp. HKCCD7357]NNV18427.1 type-F conjugative transfer system protein TraW [Roseobacter sp. HKCCD8768]NNV27876.1 type-F conjugative transfer system protein TraW [Roseobacter sp. HKCCD8192]NNV32142.1 type-F conjugative transfer system prote